MAADDPLAALRQSAAQRLRSLADKHSSIAATWLAMVNRHAGLSTTMLADAVASGKLDLGLLLSNTAAMTVECYGAGFDILLGNLVPGASGNIQYVNFIADASASGVGPLALVGVDATQVGDVVADNVVQLGIAAPAVPVSLPVTVSTLGNTIVIEVKNLRPNDQPQPEGVYSGKVNITVNGQPKLLAVVTLVRTP